MDVHFVRDRVSKGVLKIIKIASEKRADILTKPLNIRQHDFLYNMLRLCDPFNSN